MEWWEQTPDYKRLKSEHKMRCDSTYYTAPLKTLAGKDKV